MTSLRMAPVEPSSADLNWVQRLEDEAFGPAALNLWTLKPLCDYAAIWLFRQDDEVVGSATAMRCWQRPDRGYIWGFIVRQGFRGRGIGGEGIGLLLDELARAGINEVELTVEPENAAALGLYHGAGFTRVAETPDYFGPGKDRVTLRWLNANVSETPQEDRSGH